MGQMPQGQPMIFGGGGENGFQIGGMPQMGQLGQMGNQIGMMPLNMMNQSANSQQGK